MGLQAVLTLLSNAIQGDGSPEEVDALIAAADLTASEREDLRAIPYHRLIPYQNDLYYADRNMLVWGFSNTWHCLRQLQFGLQSTGAERAFVVRFKMLYPCPSHSVRELGSLFVNYLGKECRDLCSQYPWLLEIAEAERLETEVLYAMDNPRGTAMDTQARKLFFEQSLDDLLAAKVTRAERVTVTERRFDLAKIKGAVAQSEEAALPMDFNGPAFQPMPTPQYFAIARDFETLAPVWYHASEIDAHLVAMSQEDVPRSLEDIAEDLLPWLASADQSEEVIVSNFLCGLERALRCRYLLIA